jgi:hypothetical protein
MYSAQVNAARTSVPWWAFANFGDALFLSFERGLAWFAPLLLASHQRVGLGSNVNVAQAAVATVRRATADSALTRILSPAGMSRASS